MKPLFYLLFAILLTPALGLAQTGVIKGSVTDSTNQEEVIGAVLILSGTSHQAVTDIYGNYKMERIPVGEYELVVSFFGYAKFTRKVKVTAGDELVLDVLLKEDSETTLKIVNVTAERKTSSENAVLVEIKEAKAVVSGVSKEQIARSQDKTAADVMQRVPGITVVENKFALIRGVSSRYNSVTINNITAPSTEIDRKTFSFDLISSGALDRMLIYKSASPEYPGDFAGGVIKIFTVNTIDEDIFNVSVNVNYRMGTTFEPYFQTQGSKTDFLGFDGGGRQLPALFPAQQVLAQEPKNSVFRMETARLLNNNFSPSERMALPDMGFGVNFGKSFKIGNAKVTTLNSFGYSQGYQYFAKSFYRYDVWTNFDIPINPKFEYIDDTYQKDNKINLMSNWSVRLGSRTTIRFSNLFNQIGENETIIRNGDDFQQRPGQDLKNYLFGYKARTIYSGQLEGVHKLDTEEKHEMNWVLGGSYLGEVEPDLRRFRRFKEKDSSNYIQQVSPSSNLFDNSRYYGKLSEFTVSHGLNYNYEFGKEGAKKNHFKTGYYVDYRDRSFASRYFSYTYPGFFDPVLYEQMIRQDLDVIFKPENLKNLDGFVLEEGTRPIDAYTAANMLGAVYAMGDVNLGRFNLSGGARAEYNVQQMDAQDDFSIIKVNNPIFSLLPSLNVSFELTKKSLVRAGYGRTVNRPEFRELAPFLFYDYKLESSRTGNPELKVANIDNIDLRYEYYPRSGETMSVGVFYKRFKNPIEDRLIITTEQSTITYINADLAFNYGAEVELKKSFKDLTSSTFIEKFSLNLNAAYIFSQVDLGSIAVAQDQVRPLQSQAPYIINAALYYNNNKAKFNASLIYNIYGRNIFAVGDVSFPTMYELERHSLDLTFGKAFKSGVSIKCGIQNILDAPFRFYQDSDRNNKIDLDIDDPIIIFKRGSLFTFNVTYDLFHYKKKKAVTAQ